ncbi:hypothetical protein [Vibrio sp. HN007]|uniref:hypothetical protein n=1 Tax=Vibrio iocasae TaxID=3098914 RepID=UPI0035D47F51
MVMSVIRFLTILALTVVCTYSLNMAQGEVPMIALLIPALWIYPQSGINGVLLLIAMSIYGLTLSHQPLALSISSWILFPMLLVAFEPKSNNFVRGVLGLCVLAMYSGIVMAQGNGSLGGSTSATLIQLLSVALIWYVTFNWHSSKAHSWGSLLFILPMWIAGLEQAALIALSVTGIISVSESLKNLEELDWGKLLCWALPTVGFSALLLFPDVEMPSQVLIAWIFMFGTAWMTDYFLNMESLD